MSNSGEEIIAKGSLSEQGFAALARAGEKRAAIPSVIVASVFTTKLTKSEAKIDLKIVS